MQWLVRTFVPCTHHVFLSHSREDHDALVLPVYTALKANNVIPWIDRHDYPYGPTSREALQDGILRCRHVVFFVTPAMLNSSRGWCVLELAYANILQSNLQGPGRPYSHLMLPLFFFPPDDPLLPRTVWRTLRDRGAFFEPAKSQDRTGWAVSEVMKFLRAEEGWTNELRVAIRRDRGLRDSIPSGNGLRDRVSRFHPQPLPE